VKNEPAAAQPATLVAANARHVELIRRILLRAETIDLPLWLMGGWALDARLGRMTRVHADIDLAFPAERRAEFAHLLRGFAAGTAESNGDGFLVRVEGVLLDCQPCLHRDGGHAIDGMPAGSCPAVKEGRIVAIEVRCASWQTLLWAYFRHLHLRPLESWPPKYRGGYALAREAVGAAQAEVWLALFRAQRRLG
jgi:aminoglycoside 2''-adenylyltransferase